MPRKKDFHDNIVSKPPEKRPFNVIPFECAEVKSEPEDHSGDAQPEIFVAWSSHRTSSVATQTSKRHTANRAVQADLLPVVKDSIVSGTTVDEPLGPDLTKGAIEKQCRICLRRLPEASLAYILFPQKTRILTTLGVKVYLGDAYPFICRNCAALVDLMYDFRSACVKARNMLVHERKSLAGDGWDCDENLGTILRVKSLVESHRREVDAAYELSSLSKGTSCGQEEEEDVKIKPEAIELVMVEPTPIESSSSDEDDDSSNHSLKIDNGGGHSDSGSESDSPVEGDNPSPPPSSPPPKKKRIRIVTKPYKKRQKKKLKEESEDEDQSRDEGGKERKRRKNAADPNRKRGALCDFCGDWVEYHTVESHKNQHLGIKPYICQTEGCKLAFSCRNLLVKHIKRQHGAAGPEYHDCDVCGHRIKGPKAALKKHQKTHTEEKNFICAVCGKGFTTQGYLRQHSIIHTDLMPFECGVCHRKFNNKYNMLTHEKKHFQRGEMVPSESFNPAESNANGPREGDREGAGQRPEVTTTTLTVEPAAPTPLPPFADYHHQMQQHQQHLHHTSHLHQQPHHHHPHIQLLQLHPPHPQQHQQSHHQPLLHQPQ
ncbi:zinc finger protein 652-B [Culex quinquefasciatus]|uniref:zinc finger protein 652-B n=1 Tax=Culex quinquefasciatus TaxID=7176 RepID=UPI0018E29767|nr:zinc finger protein 652-B [Culex quinquefasciatus]